MGNQRGKRDHRQSRFGYLRQSVAEAVKKPHHYELGADLDTGEVAGGVEIIEPGQQGAMSALLSQWQVEQVVDNLETDERDALSRSGFWVRKTRGTGSYWVLLRERRISKLFVSHLHGEWTWARADSIHKCRFRPILGEGSVQLPAWDGYPDTPEVVVRETAAAAIQILADKAPLKLIGDDFYSGMLVLCNEVVQRIKEDADFCDLVYRKIPSQKGNRIIFEEIDEMG